MGGRFYKGAYVCQLQSLKKKSKKKNGKKKIESNII